MTITATHINLLNVCHRELWLHANEIRMEHTSDIVFEGKHLHETAYSQRAEKGKEVEISVIFKEDHLAAKIDFIDYIKKEVHETKKSDKLEHAHEAQLKYYLFLLELSGVSNLTGILEYPTQKKKRIISLSDIDRVNIKAQIAEAKRIINLEYCPALVKKTYCKTCSYFDFCWISENIEEK
jgi:CRISPR-associated exonuclease Cas4